MTLDSDVNKTIAEMVRITSDFETCSKIMSGIDITKLPAELQLRFAASSVEFAKAMKKYNDEMKQVIVIASALGRT